MNRLRSIPKLVVQERLTNPVIGRWGQSTSGSESSNVFLSYAVSMWRVAINLGALIVLLYYVLAAYEWLTSGSDSKGVDKAKQRFTNATIGLILLVASFAIVAFINELVFQGAFDMLELTLPVGR